MSFVKQESEREMVNVAPTLSLQNPDATAVIILNFNWHNLPKTNKYQKKIN
jgi:hypothetical protein